MNLRRWVAQPWRRTAVRDRQRPAARLLWGLLVGLGSMGAVVGLASAPGAAPILAAPMAQATATPELHVLHGVLRNGGLGCAPAGAHIEPCDGSDPVPVHSGVIDLLPFLDQDVELKGVLRPCASGEGSYLQLASVSPRPCNAATPPPPPSGVRNLALNAPVVASYVDAPGREPQHLTDGDPVTDWYVPPGREAWAYVDLGSEMVFNELILRWGEAHAEEFAVYVWDDQLGDGGWLRITYRPDSRGGEERMAIPRAEGRFVLFHLARSSMPQRGFELREIEIYGQRTPNLALGCVARAGTAQGGRAPYKAIDGDLSTDWASVPGEAHPHLVITCDQPLQLAEIRIHWHETAFGAYYRVAFYRGGGILPRGFGIENRDGGRDRISWLDPVEADGVVVYVDGMTPGADHVAISELELFGLGANPEPDASFTLTTLRPVVFGANLEWWNLGDKGEGFANPLSPLMPSLPPTGRYGDR